MGTFQPNLQPLGSLWLSSLAAMLPLLTIFICLGVLKLKAYVSGLIALAVALVVAIACYHMPPTLALMSAVEGGVFGLFPISWIVFSAILLYETTVASGRFEDLRATFDLLSDDPRVQAILIAFCFGGMLEALAGFGAPVAITGVMLMACGFSALRAASIVLLANTAPVAFGSIAIPIITAGNLTKIPYQHIGAYVGHITPILAWIVPLFLCLLADGWRGVRQLWPIALVTGLSFGIAQWVSATWISVELTDIISSLVGLGCAVLFLRVWHPQGAAEARDEFARERVAERESLSDKDRALVPEYAASTVTGLNASRIFMALFPYLLVIVVFCICKLIKPIATWIASTDLKVKWPLLDGHVLTSAGKPNSSTIYNFQWLSSPGTTLIVCAIIVALVYRVSPALFFRTMGTQLKKLRWSTLTIVSVLALAYVMNLSGQTITIGTWIAGTGAAFAFFSPILGWLGTAVTGSDTSANALFATLQQAAGKQAGIDQTLLVAANTAGGVVGKMVSPQNLTIAATAVGLLGAESRILRKTILWSLGLLVLMCLLVGLESSVLSFLLPKF